jgi:hypothetical protein
MESYDEWKSIADKLIKYKEDNQPIGLEFYVSPEEVKKLVIESGDNHIYRKKLDAYKAKNRLEENRKKMWIWISITLSLIVVGLIGELFFK